MLLRLLEKISRKQELKVKDHTEQSILNYGFKHTAVKPLPFKYNFWKKACDWGYVDSIPRDVLNVHAAGVDKAESMQS